MLTKNRISAVVVSTDLDRSQKFYEDKVGLSLSPQTIKNYLVALQTALVWAVGQKLLPAVPKFPEIKVPKKKPQPISDEG